MIESAFPQTLPSPPAEMTTYWRPSAPEICHRRRLASRGQLVFPEFAARLDIERAQIGIQGRADEHQAAGGGDGDRRDSPCRCPAEASASRSCRGLRRCPAARPRASCRSQADGGQHAERRRGAGRAPARQPDLALHDVGRALHVGEFLADALAAGQLLAHHLPLLARNQRDHRGKPVVRHDGDAAAGVVGDATPVRTADVGRAT